MISEESYDTEDWSNDAEKTQLCITGINYIEKYIQIENSNLFLFLLYFWSNKCSLGETFFQKHGV